MYKKKNRNHIENLFYKFDLIELTHINETRITDKIL